MLGYLGLHWLGLIASVDILGCEIARRFALIALNHIRRDITRRLCFYGVLVLFNCIYILLDPSLACLSTCAVQISGSTILNVHYLCLILTICPDLQSVSILRLVQLTCSRLELKELPSVQDLRPSSDQTHAKSSREDQEASNDSFLSPEHFPTLIAEKIFRHQLHQRREDEQTSRDCIHRAHQKQPNFRVGTVQSMRRETDRLPNGCSAHVSIVYFERGN